MLLVQLYSEAVQALACTLLEVMLTFTAAWRLILQDAMILMMHRLLQESTAKRLEYHPQVTIHPCRPLSPAAQSGHFSYNWSMSSEDNYRETNPLAAGYYGRFAHIRARLDYNYHGHYTRSRQVYQDAILECFLPRSPPAHNGRPWMVFTAGVMGAGKTHTLRTLASQGIFPLDDLYAVDPDSIRHCLPEFAGYLQATPELAGVQTRKEAGYLAEILTLYALEQGQHLLVDGSLRNSGWYKDYFAQLKVQYPDRRLAIVHVTASRETVFERAKVSIR
jgi:Zeta toxin